MLAWEGTMLKIGGVSLYGHTGTLAFQKGMMTMENGKIVKGMFIVEMNTITPTDEAYNVEEGKTPEKLVGHLSSPDFFAVDSFPTATFQVTGMEDGKIMGDMTIRGITNAETMENVTMETMDGKVKATGSMTLDRQKYNVAFDLGVEDKIISDDLDLEFTIVAVADATM
jgi:polyisoprenoid-binding protein YceI